MTGGVVAAVTDTAGAAPAARAAPAAIDTTTVVRAQGGDRAALDRLLRALQAPLFAHVRGITGDDALAADVLQRALLQLSRGLPSLRDPRWARAWAYRIATREAVRSTRREQAWREALAGDDVLATHAAPTADEPPFDAALVARVPALVEALPPGARVVLRLHYLDGLTLPEVAEALERPIGTIKSRLAYGLSALRDKLAHVR
jgi:RNA polymerase sigma-70 factor (ECF subfamily)